MPQGFEVFGVDVSHHQGNIDWMEVSAMSDNGFPLRFAVIKATEGGDFKDTNYDVNYATARECGLACGAYLFYNPGTSPSSQAAFYINNVSLASGDLPPVVDVEHKGKSVGQLRKDVLECLVLLENHYGTSPIIYTSYKFWKHYLNVPDFEKYKFWIAHYYIDDPDDDIDWTIWQFTDRGNVPGIDSYVDLNVFNGSYDSFRQTLVK